MAANYGGIPVTCYRCSAWPCVCHDGITIIHGDCREVLPLLATDSIDLVLTDPPYGVEFEYGGDYRDTWDEWVDLIDVALPSMRKVGRAVMLSTSKIEGERHIWLHHSPDWRMCWYKGALSTRSAIGFKDWETVFVWGRSWQIPMHDFFHIPPEEFGAFGHPCPKPIRWAKHLISKGTDNVDSTILDPFMGSGTTLRAAKDLGRKAIGIEIEERYVQIACDRLRQEVLAL